MKKILIASLLAVFTSSFAQLDFKNTRFGVTAGINYSQVKNAHNPSDARTAFQIGGVAMIPMDKNNQFYLQPELVYYGAGEKGGDAKYFNNYISVPIYFKAYFSESKDEFFGKIGPKFNFLINQKIENPSKPIYTVEGVSGVNGKASSFNFGIGFGFGYSFKRKVEFGFNYDMGISNTYPNLMKESGTDPAIQKSKTEHVVSAGISYIFD